MIIVNTTFHVYRPLTGKFLAWLRKEYAPSAARAGLVAPRFTEILAEVEPDSVSYAFAVCARDMDDARDWHEGPEATRLRASLTASWGQQILPFTTYMKSVSLT